MKWAEKYVGLPFVDGGRDWKGCDCWGLVKLILQTECGIEVPSYGDIAASELLKVASMVADETKKEPWHPVIHAQTFDVESCINAVLPFMLASWPIERICCTLK